MSVLEFRNRIGQPYYHLERFIVRVYNEKSFFFLFQYFRMENI